MSSDGFEVENRPVSGDDLLFVWQSGIMINKTVTGRHDFDDLVDAGDRPTVLIMIKGGAFCEEHERGSRHMLPAEVPTVWRWTDLAPLVGQVLAWRDHAFDQRRMDEFDTLMREAREGTLKLFRDPPALPR